MARRMEALKANDMEAYMEMLKTNQGGALIGDEKFQGESPGDVRLTAGLTCRTTCLDLGALRAACLGPLAGLHVVACTCPVGCVSRSMFWHSTHPALTHPRLLTWCVCRDREVPAGDGEVPGAAHGEGVPGQDDRVLGRCLPGGAAGEGW